MSLAGGMRGKLREMRTAWDWIEDLTSKWATWEIRVKWQRVQLWGIEDKWLSRSVFYIRLKHSTATLHNL